MGQSQYSLGKASKFPTAFFLLVCYVISHHCCTSGETTMGEGSNEEEGVTPRPYTSLGDLLHSATLPNWRRSFDGVDDPKEPIICSAKEEDQPAPMGRGLIDRNKRWGPKVKIYYDPEYTPHEIAVIDNGLWGLHHLILPCVQYYKHSSPPSGDYIYIRKAAPGHCTSYIGRQGGKQIVNLGPRCITYGTIVHEFLHALGVHHEHVRPDRDDYVEVKWENLDPGGNASYEKKTWTEVCNYGVPYNIKSVMHYNNLGFSKNGKPTMVVRNGTGNEVMGYFGEGKVQDTDIKLVRRMYNCPE